MGKMRVNGYDYDWSDVRKRLSAIKESFPRAMAVVAQNFFVDSFRRQGWYEARSLKRWKARKKPDKSYKRRAILIKSGRLRRSIRIREATFVNITIAAEAPYAAAHNNGINAPQHVRAHTRHRPQSPASLQPQPPRFPPATAGRSKPDFAVSNLLFASCFVLISPLRLPQSLFLSPAAVQPAPRLGLSFPGRCVTAAEPRRRM